MRSPLLEECSIWLVSIFPGRRMLLRMPLGLWHQLELWTWRSCTSKSAIQQTSRRPAAHFHRTPSRSCLFGLRSIGQSWQVNCSRGGHGTSRLWSHLLPLRKTSLSENLAIAGLLVLSWIQFCEHVELDT